MSETIEERWPKRWHCVEARDNEFAEQSGPGKPIMAVRNGVNIGTVDLCPKCYETFGHHAARPDQPPFAPGQTVRDTRTGKQHKVARCEKSVVYGTLRWIVDDHNGSRAFADDCVLVHAGTLTTEAVAALVAETEHCFKPLEPSPVRYACTKIAKAGHTVKILAPSDGRLCRVLAVNDPRLLLRPLNGDGDLELLAEFVEFVPEVTIAHPVCRGCNQPLKDENAWMSDGCPCNSPRGINHGLVPKKTCTCEECDPAEPNTTCDFDFDEAANKAAAVIIEDFDDDTTITKADWISDQISAQIRPGVQQLYAKLQHRRCDTCGANTIDGCTRCGAPQCCPQCCKIDDLTRQLGTMAVGHLDTADQCRERLAVAMSLLGQSGARSFLLGAYEARLKDGKWSLQKNVMGSWVYQGEFADPVQAALRAKELADIGKAS